MLLGRIGMIGLMAQAGPRKNGCDQRLNDLGRFVVFRAAHLALGHGPAAPIKLGGVA